MDAWTSTPVLSCRSCGTELPFDARFCWSCGTPVNPATPSPTAPEPQPDEAALLKRLHHLARTGWLAYSEGDHGYIPNLLEFERKILQPFPHLVNEPFGKERRTVLHTLAFASSDDTRSADSEKPRREWLHHTLDVLLATPGIDVNARDWEGNTPLHLLLIKAPKIPNGTTTFTAEEGPNTLIFELSAIAKNLLKAGTDPNAVNNSNETPLHLAADKGLWSIVYSLVVTHGADLLALDHMRYTPLHHATKNGYEHLVSMMQAELEDRKSPDIPAPLPEPIKLPGKE